MSNTDAVPATEVARLRKASLFLKNGTLIVSIVAVAQIYFVSVFFSIPLNAAVVVGPLVAFGIYGINNLVDSEEDLLNKPWSVEFSRRWNRFIGPVSVVLHFTGVGIAFYYGGLVAGGITLVPLTAQLVYSTPWLPFPEVKRLKQVLVLNSTVVAGAWAIGVTALPISLATESVPVDAAAAVAVGVFVFLRWIISVEVANAPDVRGDLAANVDSLPIEFGIDGTRWLMYGLEVLSALPLLYLLVTVENSVAVLAVLAVLAYTVGCEYLLCRTGRTDYLSIAWDVSFALMALAVSVVDFALGASGGVF